MFLGKGSDFSILGEKVHQQPAIIFESKENISQRA